MVSKTVHQREPKPDGAPVDPLADERREVGPPECAYITVKLGRKGPYTSTHVNAVYEMVQDMGPPGEFYCVTDDAEGLKGEIIPLRPHLSRQFPGWFQKLCLFREDPWGITKPFLYLDLDVVLDRDWETQ